MSIAARMVLKYARDARYFSQHSARRDLTPRRRKLYAALARDAAFEVNRWATKLGATDGRHADTSP